MKRLSRLWSILPASERASAVGIVALMLVSMLLEMIGVGIVVPALGLMTGNDATIASPELAQWLAWLKGWSRVRLVVVGLVGMVALYAFKVAFLLFASWRQVAFVSRVQADVARRLFRVYLSQPWTFHLQRNTAELIRNICDIPKLAQTCAALFGTIAEILIIAGILGMLLWFEPVGALVVGALMAAATWILERVTRRRLVSWGDRFHHHARLGYKQMLEGLQGAKDVKMRGCERAFVEQYGLHTDALAVMQGRQMLFGHLPRLWYEFLAVAALCTLTALMAWQGKATAAMIPTLGLFAAAAFRLLPSINRVATTLQALRFSTAVIDTVAAELAIGDGGITDGPARPLSFHDAIALEHVSFRYPDTSADTLIDICMRIPRGQSVGIVGGSGAGKSTLVDVILGLLAPSAGRVAVDGSDIATHLRAWQATVGYVPQTIYLCDDSLRRNVAFGVSDERFDETAFGRAIRAAQLEDFVASLPNGAETLIGEQGVRLSGGQRQRIGIARALYHDPAILVLDEATSSLDTATEKGVMDAVDALHGEKTLIIVAHRLTTVANCDVIYRLDGGRIVETGTFAEVFSK